MTNVKLPKRHFKKAKWHVITLTAHHLLRDLEVKKMTSVFNAFKRKKGTTKKDKAPVQETAIKRYCNGGSGYENGPPKLFKRFVNETYSITKKQVALR
ncbi:MAG: hypothetical protein E4H14_09390 [Candidatus Thorarchaeota archaeon]|nr:MAG: hypothetical protein E4H14_09390 [Candidatus Thorarchaeota archaeon]